MMWAFAAKFGFDFFTMLAREFLSKNGFYIFLGVYFLFALVLGSFIFRVATWLYSAVSGIICLGLSLLPCLGLFTVLILNGGAIDRLRKGGCIVGFMGATREQMNELIAASK